MDPLEFKLQFLENVAAHSVGAIADGAITTAKLADSSVTTDKIAAGAVVTSDIANDAVTVAKLNSSFATLTTSGGVSKHNIFNPTGTSGVSLNGSTQNLELVAAGFNLTFDGVNIAPQGKTKATFTFSASDQSWVVPAGITYIYAKLWGAGGGGGHYGGWSFGSWGGAGGFTRGIIPVTAGETLTLRVPRGGYARPGSTDAPFGGGSSVGGGDNQYGGGGGGYCGIFRSSTPLLIAGAGGGGGSISGDHSMCNGGAGGGLNGMRGEAGRGYTATGGGGGSQTAGGAAGTGTSQGATAGSSLQGGEPNNSVYGGGGGGGYYGGGGGAYTQGNTMGGGGGGSGYVATTVILGSTHVGRGAYPPAMDDIDYPASTASTYSSVGYGGMQNNNGGDGYIVIYY